MQSIAPDGPDDDLSAWLAEDDEKSRPYRVERLRLLLQEYGEGDYRVFPGGPASLWAFEEARLAYLHGLYLACVLLCQTCVEHMLAGMLRMGGRDDLDHAGCAAILREARAQGLVSADEYGMFDRVRQLRNPYAHHRPPLAKGTVELRAVRMNTAPHDLLEDDALCAITALLRICGRHPFAIADDD